MAYRKLKDFVADGVNPDGTRIGDRYGESHKQTMYVETTGDMRLFLIVPEFMASALGDYRKNGVDLIKVDDRKTKSQVDAIAGRDPELIEKAWSEICTLYTTLVNTVDLKPMIRIKRDRDHFRGGPYLHDNEGKAMLHFEFERYLRNSKELPTERGHHRGYREPIKDYEWNDEGKPLKSMNRWQNEEGLLIPYTPLLWERLCLLQQQITAAGKRLEELCASGEIVAALTGPQPLQLSGPKA